MEQQQRDRSESAKNPYVPGARILRRAAALPSYDNASATMRWHYPLSTFNDAGLFAYVEKRADSDADRPWASQAHPFVNLYMYVLRGTGTVTLGAGDPDFEIETYDYEAGDLVVIPRGIPYKHTGDWDATFCHVRTSVFGERSGPTRYPHPIQTCERPERPTAIESENLAEPGTLTYIDPVRGVGITGRPTVSAPVVRAAATLLRPDVPIPPADLAEVFRSVTPLDEQTADARSIQETRKNPTVLGARVLRKQDAPAVYNSHSGNKKRGYPLSWADDFAIFHRSTHSSISDEERPWGSHSHPEVEEMNYILEGGGQVTMGIGDDTFENETYSFGEGDLVITPRGVPHKFVGDFTMHVFHAKASVFGTVPGTSRYPHPAYTQEKPPRPTAEEQADMHDAGTYLLMDARETISVIMPDPILSIVKMDMSMGRLRPDLFDADEVADGAESAIR